jgi:hypothetical protein
LCLHISGLGNEHIEPCTSTCQHVPEQIFQVYDSLAKNAAPDWELIRFFLAHNVLVKISLSSLPSLLHHTSKQPAFTGVRTTFLCMCATGGQLPEDVPTLRSPQPAALRRHAWQQLLKSANSFLLESSELWMWMLPVCLRAYGVIVWKYSIKQP